MQINGDGWVGPGALCAVLSGLVGCAECATNVNEIPCPKPFDVVALCEQSQDCVDEKGHPFDACGSESRVLRIPIAQFAEKLAGIPDLRIVGGGCSVDGTADAAGFEASLDGIPGAHFFDVNNSQGGTFRRWLPFPSSPKILEITHSSGGFGAAQIEFKSWECDSRNPAIECAL
jgi:hypothetical protein